MGTHLYLGGDLVLLVQHPLLKAHSLLASSWDDWLVSSGRRGYGSPVTSKA